MKKYSKVRRLGHPETNGILSGNGPLYIKEKVDGANVRFSINDGENKLVFGSRNVVYKNERDTDKNFIHAIEYVRDHVDVSDIEDLGLAHDPEKLVFFGEAMHPHTIEYGATSGTEIGWKGVPSFIGFDVWYDGEFLTTEAAKNVYVQLGLPFVNIVDACDPSEFMDEYGVVSRSNEDDDMSTSQGESGHGEDFVPDSAYYDGPAEGVVLSNDGQKAKLVSEQFSEKHGSVNSGADDVRDDDTYDIVETYCTDARIRKHVHKLENEGHDIERSMMAELPVRVTTDIIEEEAHEFATSNWVVDFSELRSRVAQSPSMRTDCLSVIDTMMSESISNSDDTNEVEA